MPPSYRQALGIGDDYRLEVTPGDEYVVYGVGMERELVWFYLCAGYGYSFPVRYPFPLVQIVDARVFSGWVLGSVRWSAANGEGVILAIPDWVNDPTFYTRLTDLDDDAARVFRGYRRIIDAEAYGEDGVDDAVKD
jgi:hypothetical protein